MLDLVHVLLIAAAFALIGLVAKGVEKLGPRAESATRRDASQGEERA